MKDILSSAVALAIISSLVAFVVSLLPKAAGALAAFINERRFTHGVTVIDHLVSGAVAYFKANEPAFQAKGISLSDYVFGHVSVQIPGIDKTTVDHAIALFLTNLASDLK